MNVVILVIFGSALVEGALIVDQDWVSGCSKIFIFEDRNNETGKWYGYLTLLNEDELFDVWIRLLFDGPVRQVGNWFAPIVTMDNQNFLIENHHFHLKAYSPLTVRFFVEYDPLEPLPKLTLVRLNGRTVCPEEPVTEAPIFMQLYTSIILGKGYTKRESMSATFTTLPAPYVTTAPPSVTTFRGTPPILTTPEPTSALPLSLASPMLQETNATSTVTPDVFVSLDSILENRKTTTHTNDFVNRIFTNTTSGVPMETTTTVNQFVNSIFTNATSGVPMETTTTVNQFVNSIFTNATTGVPMETTTNINDFFDSIFVKNETSTSTEDFSTLSSENYINSIFEKSETELTNTIEFLPRNEAATLNDVCGTVIPQPKPLISFGTPTRVAEIPWHAVIYTFDAFGNLAFSGGGSLISAHHILTAARCVTADGTVNPIFPQNLLVYLGKYNVKKFSGPEIQLKDVDEVIVHPKFELQNFNNDLAVVKLKTPAMFTDYVRPVCLWTESKGQDVILNKYGRIAGWGLDQSGTIVNVLSYVNMPVVTEKVCINSYPVVYSRFTNDNTFCAGDRNGTTVCSAETGGGFVFPISSDDRANPRWQLRGIASFVPSTGNGQCDLFNYVVFMDVATYLDWIRGTLLK